MSNIRGLIAVIFSALLLIGCSDTTEVETEPNIIDAEVRSVESVEVEQIVVEPLELVAESINIEKSISIEESTKSPAEFKESIELVESPAEAAETVACSEWTKSAAVSRGSFTSAVSRKEREPVDSICLLTTDKRKIFYFSDLKNQVGAEISHLWEYEGREMAKVALGKVRGKRWRVWSSKNLMSGWQGEWTVKVITKDGSVLHQESFIYTK